MGYINLGFGKGTPVDKRLAGGSVGESAWESLLEFPQRVPSGFVVDIVRHCSQELGMGYGWVSPQWLIERVFELIIHGAIQYRLVTVPTIGYDNDISSLPHFLVDIRVA